MQSDEDARRTFRRGDRFRSFILVHLISSAGRLHRAMMLEQRLARLKEWRTFGMLGSAPIVAFVAVTQREQARAFYADILGLHLTDEDPFALMFDAGGTRLRLALVEQLQPQGFTVLGWIVADITATARELAARGVKFNRYQWMEQDELGIWGSPSGAQVAWFPDPDGNILSITELN